MEPIFYYDLGKNPYSHPWDKWVIGLGVCIVSFSTYKIIQNYSSFFHDLFPSILQLIGGVLFILNGVGVFYRKGKHFLKITDQTISYRLPGASQRDIPVAQLALVYVTSSYIFFKLQNGWQDTIKFSTIYYKPLTQFKAALQTLKLPQGTLEYA